MKSHKEIMDAIDSRKDDAIEFLQKMVSIPSVTGDEGPIQAFASDYLNKMGLEVDMWESDWEALKKHPSYTAVDRGYEGRPNIVATHKGTGGGRSLLLNGHTDVIPVNNGRWTVDPWSALIKDGKLYGRGACDMKSGVATHIMAVKFLKEMGVKLKGDVLLNLVIDEEVSGHGTLDTVIRGYRADAGLSGETSGLAVQPGCIGRIWFEINIQGKSAGIQRHYEAIDGIQLGNKVVAALRELEAERQATVRHPLYPNVKDSLPIVVGCFHAGLFPSAVAANCVIKGSMATLPGEDHQGVKQQLIDKIRACADANEWMKDHQPVVTFVGLDAEASDIPVDHPIVKTLVAAYKECLGTEPEISGRQGAADTRFLNNLGNTPTVIFGPGMTSVMHSDDEYVSVEDYLNAVKIVALTIVEWCGQE